MAGELGVWVGTLLGPEGTSVRVRGLCGPEGPAPPCAALCLSGAVRILRSE
jgi:hypothetical protein